MCFSFTAIVVKLVIAASVSDISQSVNCWCRSLKPYLEVLNAKNATGPGICGELNIAVKLVVTGFFQCVGIVLFWLYIVFL